MIDSATHLKVLSSSSSCLNYFTKYPFLKPWCISMLNDMIQFLIPLELEQCKKCLIRISVVFDINCVPVLINAMIGSHRDEF